MENPIIQTTEVADTVLEKQGSGLGVSALIIGGSMFAGAVAWNKLLKPAGRFIKAKIARLREEKAIKVKETVDPVKD